MRIAYHHIGLVLFLPAFVPSGVVAQTTLLHQGFETSAACFDWGYAGGVVNTLTANPGGTRSLRVGRCGESNTATFNTVDVSGLTGLQLSVYHSVLAGNGPGMDAQEGAVMQVRLNGGAWATIGQVGGYNNYDYGWAATIGGSTLTGCNVYQCPNPLVYPVPGGTATLAFRVVSVNTGGSSGDPCLRSGSCASFNTMMTNATADHYSRSDEGFYIDDVRLTTTSADAAIPRIWTGRVNTDWHECRNWLYGSIPNANSVVTIDQTSLNHCEVYTANAACSSLDLRSNNATIRNLTIRADRTLTVGNGVSVTRTGAATAMGITLNAGATAVRGHLVCGSLTLFGHALGGASAYLRNKRENNTLRVLGDMTIASGGQLDLQGATAAQNGILRLEGDWNNWDGEAAFMDVNSRVRFEGGQLQALNTTGFEERFRFIEMQKSAEDLHLAAPIRLTLALAFPVSGGGRIFSSLTNLVTFDDVAQVNNANDGGHVNGPVQKFGTANFHYPIGKDGVYRPARTRDVIGSSTDAFTAEYIHISARIAPHGPLVEQPPLHHVSDCEHWIIRCSSGTPTARVELSWHNVLSCGVTAPVDLRVAWWHGGGAIWRDRGNDEVSIAPWGGWVSSIPGLVDWGAFTLSSTSGDNPLPIELLRFDALRVGREVRCDWATATERDNDFFTVERSTDGTYFTEVGRVQAAGDSWSVVTYGFTDPAPVTGLSYYRLRQTDTDGTSTVSHAVPVRFEGDGIVVLNDDGTVHVLHDMPAGSTYQVFDPAGRLVREGRTDSDRITLLPTGRPPALHMVVLHDGARTERVKVLH